MKGVMSDITVEVWQDDELLYHCRVHFNKAKFTQNPDPVCGLDDFIDLILVTIQSTGSVIIMPENQPLDERFKPVDVRIVNKENLLSEKDLSKIKDKVLLIEEKWFDEDNPGFQLPE